MRNPPKIGLALGAGAARGWAHIGVLRALEELEVPVRIVAGASAGALVGGVYACGKLRELEEMVLHLAWKEVLYYFTDFSFSRSGLVDGKKITDFIRRYVKDTDFDALPVVFRAVATDIESGREVVLDRGGVIDAIRASIAFPGIFTPLQREGQVLVDGGLVNPVPVDVARKAGANFIIAVEVSHDRVGGYKRSRQKQLEERVSRLRKRLKAIEPKLRLLGRLNARIEKLDLSRLAGARPWFRGGRTPNLFDVLGNALRVMESQIGEARLRADPPDLLIRPDVGHIGFMDFDRAEETIEAGYRAAREALNGGKGTVLLKR